MSFQTLQTDPLISLISFCRKLKHCTVSQLHQLPKQIDSIFYENDQYDLLIDILLKGISSNRSRIKPFIWQQINDILPSEKQLKIQDTITTSKYISDDDAKQQYDPYCNDPKFLNLLTIPQDIKIHTFQYLNEMDIYRLQKTCRSILIDARNSNSFYKITINALNINNYTQNPRYNKIKVIHFDFDEEHTNSEPILPSINTFNSVHTVNIAYLFQFCQHSEFESILSILYQILSSKKQSKSLTVKADGWIWGSWDQDVGNLNSKTIFNHNINNLAQKAVLGLNCLDIEVYTDAFRAITKNLIATLSYLEMECDTKHTMDIKFTLNHTIKFRDSLWEWSEMRALRRYSNRFEMNIDAEISCARFNGYDFWKDMSSQLLLTQNHALFDIFQIKFSFNDSDHQHIACFEEYCKQWMVINSNKLKQIGMERIGVMFEYELFETYLYEDEDEEEQKEMIDGYLNCFLENQIQDKLNRIELFCHHNTRLQYEVSYYDIECTQVVQMVSISYQTSQKHCNS